MGLPADLLVGKKLRELRTRKGLSLRALAEQSGLNVNTLSLIENGKSSPSVSTLQQLAIALDVPITAFFEVERVEKRVVFTPADQRPQVLLGGVQMHNLAEDLRSSSIQPFIVTLEPGTGSGERMIVHTGVEFVYCLSGRLHYRVDGQEYALKPGDGLTFEAHLPHCWENQGEETAQILLILHPGDEREEELGQRHFLRSVVQKEVNMKIAVITEDGKTISQHFGRAPYYLVLTVENGQVVNREMREKLGHGRFGAEHHGHGEEHHHGAGHGLDSGSHRKHVSMAEAIADCQVLICGGMGMGAYDSMRRLNIQPIVTDLRSVDEAVQAYLAGNLTDHPERLH